jgi:hypothetical protein
MPHAVVYSPRERFWLWVLAVFGISALNGTFIYTVVAQPNAVVEALANPMAAAFIVESLVLVGVLAYLLTRWKVSRMHWGWFVFLSLLGSIAFALPVALLASERDSRMQR